VPTVLIFLCSSGILFIWYILKRDTLFNAGGTTLPGFGLDPLLRHIGLGNSNYDSFTRVHFQPQHALAGWLGAALLYETAWVRKSAVGVLFVWASTLLWSPFTALALFVIPLLSLTRVRVRDYFEPGNVLSGGVLLGIIALYYGAHDRVEEAGVIWALAPDARWFAYYVAFVASQTLAPVICVYVIDRRFGVLDGFRMIFWGMVAVLLVLPLVKFGFHSDLRMQASGPAMVFVSLGIASCLTSSAVSWRHPAFLALIAAFALGALYPVTRPVINLLSNRSDWSADHQARTGGAQNLSDIRYSQFDAAAQYLGSKGSFVYRHGLQHDK
jgi:hypothetical protein